MKFLAILAVLGLVGYMLFAPSAATPVKGKLVFGQVITATGKKADAASLQKQKLLLLYFSAHWCPPCRAFTPELVKYYNDNGGGKQFDVLFVSADESRDDMLGYMSDMDMPWKGAEFGSDTAQRLRQTYCGQGIPCLVAIDSQGKVLSDSFVDGNYVGPHKVLADVGELLK